MTTPPDAHITIHTTTNIGSDHFYWRLHEWVMSISVFVTGGAMLIAPNMKNGSIFSELERALSGEQIAWLFFILGGVSIFALIANGQSLVIGPRVRSICAIIRMILWAEFAVAMAQISFKPPQDWLSPMVIFFGVFTWAEYYIAYRSVLDNVRSAVK